MPRKSATAVAEKPARKTRTPKATPVPEPVSMSTGFQVGDRVFYVQETNTGVVQELKGDEALVKLSLAASKPLWLGLKQLHPYTVNHVVDVKELKEGDLIKGQTLQGDEYSGNFTGLTMSGMVMIKAVDGNKRMLSPQTLVRIAGVEGGSTPAGGSAPTPRLGRKARKSKASADAPPPSADAVSPSDGELPQPNTDVATVQPNVGDRMDGLSLTGNYHSGVFVEVTTSGLFLVRKDNGTDVIITPDSARILEQQALPIELPEFPTELPLGQIRLDKGLQPRGGLDKDHVQDMVEALGRGESLPPVGIKFDGETYWLYSGFHRVEAHRMADRNVIAVSISSGDYRDAKIAAAPTNTDHGLKRSPETKRRVVSWFLADPEWCQWSDRQIAEATKTSHVFVGKMRREMADAGELPSNVVDAKRKFERNGQVHEMAMPAQPRPKDPIPSTEELHIMFAQIGTVKPAVKGTGFAVENPIGTPFPLAFKNRLQAWDWWQNHTDQIARLVSGKGDYTPPLEPHPQELTAEVVEGLVAAGLQICRPSISPEEFNREMEKPLPLPNNGGDIPKGVCNLVDISGGYRLDGLEISSEVYLKLVAVARQYTKDMSLKGAIEFLVTGFEMQEGA